jgi:peptidyl-dipeptidase Dcp
MPRTLALSFLLFSCATTQTPAPAEPEKAVAGAAAAPNPFFEESPLPLHYPPFDKLHDADYVPAFDRGMAEQLKDVQAIAHDPAAPTFENTHVALEKTGRLLRRVQLAFGNLSAANTDPEMQKIEAQMAPRLSAHRDEILLDPALFARVDSLYQKRAKLGLDPESLSRTSSSTASSRTACSTRRTRCTVSPSRSATTFRSTSPTCGSGT